MKGDPALKRDESSGTCSERKATAYAHVHSRIESLLEHESDLISAMATIVCELHHGFDYYDWTGFYRVTAPELLKVGPYQGGHGCLSIPFSRGVCGKCAREARTQLVPDVRELPYHIACSSSTLSEIVVPVFNTSGEVRAVLDIDSDTLAAFDSEDALHLEKICRRLTPFV